MSFQSLTLAAAFVLTGGLASAGDVTWHSDALSDSIARAQESEQMILVYCWMGGSDHCSSFWQNTLTQDKAQAALSEFVCHSADNDTPAGAELLRDLRVRTLPTIVFLTPAGEPEDIIAGHAELGSFLHELDRIQSGEKTLSALRAAAEKTAAKSADGMEARYALATKLSDLGFSEQHDAIWNEMREADPEGETLVGARILMKELVHQIAEEGGGDEKMSEWDLGPLYVRAKAVELPRIRFETWQEIGNLEAGRYEVSKACKAFSTAWKDCPEDMAADWSEGVAAYVIEAGELCTSKDKKFALAMAQECVARTEKLVSTAEPCDTDACTEACGEARIVGLATKMATLAQAWRLNGKEKKALEVIETAREMAPDCEVCEKVEEELART